MAVANNLFSVFELNIVPEEIDDRRRMLNDLENLNRSPDLTIRSENGETFRGHKLAFNLVRISLFETRHFFF
jgi:hypothetical protein